MSEDNKQNGEDKPKDAADQQLLSRALENTLANLNASIERMEEIVRKFEAGDADLDESISLLSEANDLAVSSSKELDQAVQKVVYQADDETGSETASRDESEVSQES